MKTHTLRIKDSLDVVLRGKDSTVDFIRVVEHHRENYGADADGNRGMMVDMIDDDHAEMVTVDIDNCDVYVSKESLPQDEQETIDSAIQKYLDETQPEPEDDGRDEEPDYDEDPFDDYNCN